MSKKDKGPIIYHEAHKAMEKHCIKLGLDEDPYILESLCKRAAELASWGSELTVERKEKEYDITNNSPTINP